MPSPGRALRRRKGKSDQLDALRAAHAVLPLPTDRLTEAKAGEVITALRVLSAAREGMSRQRTAAINTLIAAPLTWTSTPLAAHALAGPADSRLAGASRAERRGSFELGRRSVPRFAVV